MEKVSKIIYNGIVCEVKDTAARRELEETVQSISINGTEQPKLNHAVDLPAYPTKQSLGIENVEDKTSAQIRNELTSENVTNALDYTPLDQAEKGQPNGIAQLDNTGRVPSSQLPSYVDDVESYTTKSQFPLVGEDSKIYIDKEENKQYRWDGSDYAEISASLALGETSSTAYPGDKGAAAYAHAVTNKGKEYANGFYKIGTNSEGHVISATTVVKQDILDLGIEDTDTKVTSASNHYTPVQASTIEKDADDGDSAVWDTTNFVTGIVLKIDEKGHVTGLDLESSKMPIDPTANLGTAAYTDSTAYATAAQGEKADNAVQNVTVGGVEQPKNNGTVALPSYPTRESLGIDNVENKSASEIIDEITGEDIVDALGYTPARGDSSVTGAKIGAVAYSPDANGVLNFPAYPTRSSLGLGTAATMNVPSASGGQATSSQVVRGDDPRLSDARPASDVSSWAKASTKPTYSATEVGALANTTKYGKSIDIDVDSEYKVTIVLKDQNGTQLSSDYIDLPLESVVVGGTYDKDTKKVILTLQNEETIEFSVADLVSGLQSEITLSNKLSSDLVDDTNKTHKFATATQLAQIETNKNNIANKADKSTAVTNVAYNTTSKKLTKTINGTTSDIVTVATLKTDMGLDNVENKSASDIISEITPAAISAATAAQGTKADSAVQTIQINGTTQTKTNGVVNLPAYPTTLKNPNALKVQGNGTDSFTYDGSAAKTLNIKAGSNITVGSDTSGNITINGTANTWTAMVGATSSANGSVGYVNAVPPKDGYNTKFLRADGSWNVPPDTKVTSAANHYTPSTASGSDKTASASGATAAWSIDVVKGVTLNTDGKGHVTGLSVTSGKIPANPNTDRYVNTATFADDTTSSAASPVKMALTRAGSDSATVTANIPKVSSTSAGVAPKGAAVSSQSQTTKFLREDGTWATPSYTKASNIISAMTGYSKPSSTSAISTSDSLNAAIGKLEKALDGKASTSSLNGYLPTAGGTMTGDLVIGNDAIISSVNSTNPTEYWSLHFNNNTAGTGYYRSPFVIKRADKPVVSMIGGNTDTRVIFCNPNHSNDESGIVMNLYQDTSGTSVYNYAIIKPEWTDDDKENTCYSKLGTDTDSWDKGYINDIYATDIEVSRSILPSETGKSIGSETALFDGYFRNCYIQAPYLKGTQTLIKNYSTNKNIMKINPKDSHYTDSQLFTLYSPDGDSYLNFYVLGDGESIIEPDSFVTLSGGVRYQAPSGTGNNLVVDANGAISQQSSTRTIKHDIKYVNNDLIYHDALMNFKPATFIYNTDESNTPKLGMIAEDVDEVCPIASFKNEDGSVQNYDDRAIIAMLVMEVQRLNKKLEELKQ